MKSLHRILGYLENIETNICRLLLVVMCVVVVVQVFARYLFNHSFVWAEELVRYLMIWMVMIGAARVEALGEHIRIDFFPLLAGPRGRRLMEVFFRLCTLTFLIIIFVKGINVAAFNRLFESSGLRVSMLWPTLAIPVGALLIILYTLKGLGRDVYQSIVWSKDKLLEEDKHPPEEKQF
ncbi:MAG: TRAP transporter small permease [Desulfobacterales bacterium]|nr:MAG: TRAP transporter small permease [Desulfobacterales bacterium]